MNQVARPLPISTQPQLVAARQATSGSFGRNVASVDSSSVEELNPTVGAYYYYGDEGLLFREEGNDLTGNRRAYEENSGPPLFNGTGLDAPSTIFAAFFETNQPLHECTICDDERQYVGWQGQQWITFDDLRQSHRNVVRLEELGLFGIGMELSFAIGQRALLITHHARSP